MGSIEKFDELAKADMPVMKPDPHSTDFAALRTLRLVHAHGSFSRAAESLGVTQSTVSYAIDRLRQTFDDPLFVRQSGTMVATERCEEVVAVASRMLDEFVALSEPPAFAPADTRAVIPLSCNYYERVTLIPGLMRHLRQAAPGIRVNILSSMVRGKEQLDRGESDLLIGPIRIDGGTYYRRTLMQDHYVCVMDARAPLAKPSLSLAEYLAAPTIVVTYGGSWQSRYLAELDAAGCRLNTVMEVPSPAALPALLNGTDLLATVPSRVAARFGAAVHCAAIPFPAPFDIDLTWTSRTHHSRMHSWLRAVIAERAHDVPRLHPGAPPA